jgi:protein disulfide-isomerase-like protein
VIFGATAELTLTMYGDISGYSSRGGGGGGRGRRPQVIGTADFYRRLPSEMKESTKIGIIMSFISLSIMLVLFLCETYAFMHKIIQSNVAIDINSEQLIRVNFNVTLYDVNCDFVSVDVWDTLGTNLQNVTKDIHKWSLNKVGTIETYHGRNHQQKVIAHEQHSLQELQKQQQMIEEGKSSAVDLSSDSIEDFYSKHELVFIDYYAPWCLWCQRLAPTWEKFAEKVNWEHLDVGIGKVDCVSHDDLCKEERIMAFPTLRWYQQGKAVMPDYKGDRSVENLLEYVKKKIDAFEDDEYENDVEVHHPGCLVAGHLMVNRVPSHIHMEAKSVNHELNSMMTNLTHLVNDFSFGQPGGPLMSQLLHILPLKRFFDAIPNAEKKSNPMKGKYYPTYQFHQAFHHHMKVISTHVPFLFSSGLVYQVLAESQLVIYEEMEMPEIKFIWDLSPLSVNLEEENRHWYDYATSLFAIIGGNSLMLKVFKPKAYH